MNKPLQKLRFQQDDGEDFPDWDTKRLGEVFAYEQPGPYLVSSTNYSDAFTTPVLTAGKTFLLGYTDETTGIYKVVEPVVLFDDFTTATKLIDFDFKIKSSAAKILTLACPGEIGWAYACLQNLGYAPQAHQRHWISVFQDIEVPWPALDEQKKIVGALSAMDEKIGSLREHKAALVRFKNGLMQKLFSQELRFQQDDGEDFPDWEEKSLSEIFDITMGQSPDSEHYNTEGLGLPLVQGNADIYKRKTRTKRHTKHFTKSAGANDILISVRAPVGEVAIADKAVAIGRGVAAMRPKTGHLPFWFQRMIAAETEWKEIQQGGIFPSITGTDLRDFRVEVPTVDEQKKIGNALSAMDAKIADVSQEITLMETFKKGLLQQMFV